MSTLPDTNSHLRQATDNTRSHGTDGNQPVTAASLHIFQWIRGEPMTHSNIQSVTEVSSDGNWDLRIITAPLDSDRTLPNLQLLLENNGVPSDFRTERDGSVTHSFGIQQLEDESQKTSLLWMHFLAAIPSNEPGEQRNWLKPGLFLKWHKSKRPYDGSRRPSAQPFTGVTMICFAPIIQLVKKIISLGASPTWDDVLVDPFLLVDMAFSSWYDRVDMISWDVTERARAIEQDCFSRIRETQTGGANIPRIDIYQAHVVAKDAIYMIEGLDAVLRSLESALKCHDEMISGGLPISETIERALKYRKELFYSTRLRTLSSEQRVKNVISLSFNLQTMRDSVIMQSDNKLMQKDSRSMKSLSMLGIFFLPISTICSVFSTPFFTSSSPPNSVLSNSGNAIPVSHLAIDPQFWMLWAISLPVTMIVFIVWFIFENSTSLKKRLARDARSDLEQGT